MENRQEATEIILRNRCVLLPLFSRVFAEEPNAELVELLASDDACAAIDLVATEQNGLGHLVSLLRSLPQGDALPAFVDDARAEYTALFYGPQKPLAPFWESVYLDPRELLFLESTADVKRRYESEGFRVNAESRVAEDSLAFELDFLAQLAQRTGNAFLDGDEVPSRILRTFPTAS